MPFLHKKEMLRTFDTHNLISYLQYSPDWTEVPVEKGWILFVSDSSVTGVEIELVIPQVQDEHISPAYTATAIDVLSQLNNEQPERTIERIQNVSRDVLLVRNVDGLSKGSVPLKLAARQVSKLQTIVRQSSNSEVDALPYYHSSYYNSLANRMVNDFQFAHTQDRSFGFVVQSPILPNPIVYKQADLFTGEVIEPDAPVARRIVERIVRGLIATKDAVEQKSVNNLVNSFYSGFSSNMCKAVVDISRNKAATVEYSVLWSPKIKPSIDIVDAQPILLKEIDYEFLSQAAQDMKDLKPDDTFKVRGMVIGLSSSDDPHKLGVGQSVIVEWAKPDINRLVRILVDLKPQEYIDAIRAHDEWLSVEIVGEAKLIGRRWRLLKPRNFRVIPKDE